MSNLQSYIHYSINEVPLLTYGLIGITTVVLATVTLFESNNDVEDINIIPETMVSQLPPVESFNPFASTKEDNEPILEEESVEEIEEAEPIEEEVKEEKIEKNPLLGGRNKKNKTNKRKHKKNKQNKTKHHK